MYVCMNLRINVQILWLQMGCVYVDENYTCTHIPCHCSFSFLSRGRKTKHQMGCLRSIAAPMWSTTRWECPEVHTKRVVQHQLPHLSCLYEGKSLKTLHDLSLVLFTLVQPGQTYSTKRTITHVLIFFNSSWLLTTGIMFGGYYDNGLSGQEGLSAAICCSGRLVTERHLFSLNMVCGAATPL